MIFVKDTDGIFDRDPKRVKKGEKPALFYPRISIEDFEDKVSRIGVDNRDEHLLETSAINLLKQSKVVEMLTVINCRKPSLIDSLLAGKTVGSTIFKV